MPAAVAHAAGDKKLEVDLVGVVEDGAALARPCYACHGPLGRSVMPIFPSLAGQTTEYLDKQLRDFRSGARAEPMMDPMVAPLDDQDIADLSAYFASLPRPEPKQAPLEALGKRLFERGRPEVGVAPCMGCHGSRGFGYEGMFPGGFPMIARQPASYTSKQLNAFRAQTRTNDHNRVMQVVAGPLTDAEIEALARYLAQLE